jgi:hypothetical protein
MATAKDAPEKRHIVRARLKPRISAEQLAEFPEASIARKRSILYDQKFQTSLAAPYYGPARRAIRNAPRLDRSHGHFQSAAAALGEKKTDSEYVKIKKRNNSLAIETFEQKWQKLLLPGERLVTGVRSTTLPLSGVSVSVSPTAWLESEGANGAVIFLFRKSPAISEQVGRRLAYLVYKAMLRWQPSHLSLDRCIAIDVFNSRRFDARGNGSTTDDVLVRSCSEIAGMWPRLHYRGDPADLVWTDAGDVAGGHIGPNDVGPAPQPDAR